MHPEKAQEQLQHQCTALREFFDSVQIVACLHGENGAVTRHEHGSGSWYERFGLMRSWVIRNEDGERMIERNTEDYGGD